MMALEGGLRFVSSCWHPTISRPLFMNGQDLLTRDMEVGVGTSTRVGLVDREGVIRGGHPLSSETPHFRDLYVRPF